MDNQSAFCFIILQKNLSKNVETNYNTIELVVTFNVHMFKILSRHIKLLKNLVMID